MKIESTPLEGAYIITPKVFEDKRGYFFEFFNSKRWKELGLDSYNWVQENESQSTMGVLRGLHFQKGDAAQAKLVRVIKGIVFDVAVDLRSKSSSFGQWFGLTLSESNKKQFLVPRGFAHGFLVLSNTAIFSYKCDNYYSPKEDSGIIYDDIDLDIAWPKIETEYVISQKDRELKEFKNAFIFK